MGFEEEDIMVEALPDAEVDPNPAASVAVVTMLAAASADCGCVEEKKKVSGVPRFPEDVFQVKMFPEWGSNP